MEAAEEASLIPGVWKGMAGSGMVTWPLAACAGGGCRGGAPESKDLDGHSQLGHVRACHPPSTAPLELLPHPMVLVGLSLRFLHVQVEAAAEANPRSGVWAGMASWDTSLRAAPVGLPHQPAVRMGLSYGVRCAAPHVAAASGGHSLELMVSDALWVRLCHPRCERC